MNKRGPWLVAAILAIATLVVVALVVASCRGTAANGGEPTPFPSPGASLTVTPPTTAVVEVTISELTANPGLYDGAILRVSGRYQRQPLLVCDADPHPSPATWGLAEEGLTALASGMDQQLRSLLPEELMMTVEGRWRRWQGLVGCGKSAQARDFYYLEVGRVLSPSPLVMVTLTPGAGATDIAAVPPITPTLALTPTLPATDELTPTLELSPTETIEVPQFPTQEIATPDPDLFPTEVITPTALPTPTSSGGTAVITGTLPSGTPAGTPGTPTPTITGTPPTATPTVTGTPPTATPTTQSQATPTLDPGNTVEQLDLISDTSYWTGVERLEANETHSWLVEPGYTGNFVVQAFAPAPANLVLSVVKDGQITVNRQNSAAAGQIETLSIPVASDEERYEVLVESADGSATDYFILLHDTNADNGDIQRVAHGLLTPGSQQNNISLPADTDHVWYFIGNAGDDLSVTVSPGSDDDTYVALIGVGTDEDPGDIEDGDYGEEDTIDYTLSSSGLYVIVVGDYDFDGASYSIVITLQ